MAIVYIAAEGLPHIIHILTIRLVRHGLIHGLLVQPPVGLPLVALRCLQISSSLWIIKANSKVNNELREFKMSKTPHIIPPQTEYETFEVRSDGYTMVLKASQFIVSDGVLTIYAAENAEVAVFAPGGWEYIIKRNTEKHTEKPSLQKVTCNSAKI